MVVRRCYSAVGVLCVRAVVDKEMKKCRLSVAQGQNPCRWARRVEDGEDEARMREIQISLWGRGGPECSSSADVLRLLSAFRVLGGLGRDRLRRRLLAWSEKAWHA